MLLRNRQSRLQSAPTCVNAPRGQMGKLWCGLRLAGPRLPGFRHLLAQHGIGQLQIALHAGLLRQRAEWDQARTFVPRFLAGRRNRLDAPVRFSCGLAFRHGFLLSGLESLPLRTRVLAYRETIRPADCGPRRSARGPMEGTREAARCDCWRILTCTPARQFSIPCFVRARRGTITFRLSRSSPTPEQHPEISSRALHGTRA